MFKIHGFMHLFNHWTASVSKKLIELKETISAGVAKVFQNTTAPTGKFEKMFSKATKAIVWGMQTRAVQSMLDFDFICR